MRDKIMRQIEALKATELQQWREYLQAHGDILNVAEIAHANQGDHMITFWFDNDNGSPVTEVLVSQIKLTDDDVLFVGRDTNPFHLANDDEFEGSYATVGAMSQLFNELGL